MSSNSSRETITSRKTIETMRAIRDKAEELEFLFDKSINATLVTVDKNRMKNFTNLREVALAKTKLEEAVMWGLKAAAKAEYDETDELLSGD